jgi:hypothetical protein
MKKQLIKSQIFAVEARIEQIKSADFFTPKEKEVLLKVNETEKEQLYLKLAKEIEVNNPEII